MFLDVSGFTKITEKVTSEGHYGVELITNVLNRYFGDVDKIIKPHGGEIVKYGGDACLVIFPVNEGKLPDMPRLCEEIMAQTAVLDLRFQKEYGFGFHIHGAWGIGPIRLCVVGEPKWHLDYYLSSPALEAVYELADKAKADELLGPACEIPPTAELLEPQKRPTSRSANLFLPQDIIRKLSLQSNPAELRNATVLFIKLVPTQGGDITPEDYQKVYRKVQSTVVKNMGVINKIDYTDKGHIILVTFGVPFVYGNDIFRAFTVAHRVSRIRREGIEVSVGITYSNAFFGVIGAPKRYEYGIIGNAVNIAARLMNYADGGEVCLSKELLPYLVGRFETHYLGSTTLKGIKEPLDIYKLVRELPARWGNLALEYDSDPLVYDAGAFAQLQRGMSSDKGFLCVIHGSHGTGKSHMAYKLCKPYWDSEPAFQMFAAEPHYSTLRLEIFFHSMRQELGIIHFRDEFDTITAWARSKGIAFDEKMLKELVFGAPSSAGRQEAALQTVLEMLIHLYPEGRILVIENFHNFDLQSRKLILQLVRHKLYQNDKVIITSLEMIEDEALQGFEIRDVELSNWTLETASDYIRHFVPNITSHASQRLFGISRGNPRFLRDLLSHIQKHWAASSDLITHQIIDDMRSQGLLPDDLENLLQAQYESLPPDEQRFIRLGSIYGKPVNLSHVEPLFTQHDFAILVAACESLLGKGVLKYEETDVQLISFVNPLFSETVYRSILFGEKQDIHRRIATFFAGKDSDNEQVWDLAAYHWVKAQDREEIARWCGKLAQHYFYSGALELSLRMYQQIAQCPVDETAAINAELTCAELHLLLADNDKGEAILKEHEWLLHSDKPQKDKWIYLKSRLLINRSQYPELDEFLTEYSAEIKDPVIKDKVDTDHCEAILFTMDPEAIESKALPLWERLKEHEHRLAQNTLAGIIGSYYTNKGDYIKAKEFYTEKLKIGTQLKDPVSMRIGHAGLGIAHSRMGKKALALKHYHKALDLASRSGDRNGYSKVLLDLGVYYRNIGENAKALELYQQSLKLAEHIGNKIQISIVLYDIGEMYYYERQIDKTEHYVTRSLEMAKEINDKVGMSFCYDALGDINFTHGRYDEALNIYRANLRVQHQLQDIEGKAHSMGNVANVAKKKGEYAKAEKLYKEQMRIAISVNDIDDVGRTWFNMAMLDVERGNKEDALKKLEKALETFQSCDAQYFIDVTQQQIELLKSPQE
jgi:class 3 adenylate cyclase/tetratricopeptide (TPR) repeat protein